MRPAHAALPPAALLVHLLSSLCASPVTLYSVRQVSQLGQKQTVSCPQVCFPAEVRRSQVKMRAGCSDYQFHGSHGSFRDVPQAPRRPEPTWGPAEEAAWHRKQAELVRHAH